jgi:hypothetical protein
MPVELAVDLGAGIARQTAAASSTRPTASWPTPLISVSFIIVILFREAGFHALVYLLPQLDGRSRTDNATCEDRARTRLGGKPRVRRTRRGQAQGQGGLPTSSCSGPTEPTPSIPIG